mmetsp:Transcript_3606/g.7492  ORF Transcript_3606/g.7492 Transcript_3606/m.7492 type:complete len:216 (+) Transcript_3606:2182-2829(+)
MEFRLCNLHRRIAQDGKRQKVLQQRCRQFVDAAVFAICQELFFGLGGRRQTQHVGKVKIFHRHWLFASLGKPAFEFRFWICPGLVLREFLTGIGLFLDASDDLGGDHGVNSGDSLVKVCLPVIIVVAILLECNFFVNKIPYFGTIVPGVTLWKLFQVVVIVAGHVPAGPTIQLEIVLLEIDVSYAGRNLIIVYWINFARLRVAFKEFLWHVFATR